MYVTHAASKLSSSAPLVSGMRSSTLLPSSGSTISACAAADTHSPAHRFIKVTGAVVDEGGDDEEDDEALLLLLLLLLLGMMAVPPPSSEGSTVAQLGTNVSAGGTSPCTGGGGGGAEAAEAERARAAKKPNGDEAGDEADGRRRTEGEHLGACLGDVEDMEQDLCRIIARRTPPEALWTSMVL
jgi:hypothetical protein